MFKIVSHPRSGTHLLAKWLYLNYDCNVASYDQLYYSHHAIPPEGIQIHVYRECLPVMFSCYRMRERFGVPSEVGFSDFLRTPWCEMSQPETLKEVQYLQYNGEFRREAVKMDHPYAPPMHWLEINRRFAKIPHQISYDLLTTDPLAVIEHFSEMDIPKKEFTPVTTQVGWWRTKNEEIVPTLDDFQIIQKYQHAWADMIVKLAMAG